MRGESLRIRRLLWGPSLIQFIRYRRREGGPSFFFKKKWYEPQPLQDKKNVTDRSSKMSNVEQSPAIAISCVLCTRILRGS